MLFYTSQQTVFSQSTFSSYISFVLRNMLILHTTKEKNVPKREEIWIPFKKSSLPPPPGYAVPSATAPVSAAQLKQAVTLGQDLAAYTAYEVYPTFAVTTRGDAYGAFWRSLSPKNKTYRMLSRSCEPVTRSLMIISHTFPQNNVFPETVWLIHHITHEMWILFSNGSKCQEAFCLKEMQRASDSKSCSSKDPMCLRKVIKPYQIGISSLSTRSWGQAEQSSQVSSKADRKTPVLVMVYHYFVTHKIKRDHKKAGGFVRGIQHCLQCRVIPSLMKTV